MQEDGSVMDLARDFVKFMRDHQMGDLTVEL